MPSTILGTYPIIQSQLSTVDQYGIRTRSWAFTVKTTDADAYTPAKDQPYLGPGVTVTSAGAAPWVTNVDSGNLPGDLTTISVQAVGLSSASVRPVVRIIPNCPLIFGLSGVNDLNLDSVQGAGYSSSGLGVQVMLPTTVAEEASVHTTYHMKEIPVSIRGLALPRPSRRRFNLSQGQIGAGALRVNYLGFCCDEISSQRQGNTILHTLTFREKGRATLTGTDSQTVLYSFLFN